MQSHFQATGSDQVATLELELQRLGFCSWLDNKAEDLTRAVSPLPIHLSSLLLIAESSMQGMQEGVAKTNCFLLFLSKGTMARPYVQVRTAIWHKSLTPLLTV